MKDNVKNKGDMKDNVKNKGYMRDNIEGGREIICREGERDNMSRGRERER